MCVNKPVLSICIGTYNRKEVLKKLVLSILKYKGYDIEVVVVDNASTDETLEMLGNIKDIRLKAYKNENNKGGAYNILKSIDLAEGKYVLYCNDRDHLYIDKLGSLVKFLKVNNYSVIYTKTFNTKECIIRNTIDKLSSYITLHPTGIVYNRKLAYEKNIKIMNLLKYQEGVYLWCFFARELQIYEDVYIYPSAIWTEATKVFKKENKSNFSQVAIDDLFIMPKSNMAQLKCLIRQLTEFKKKNYVNEREFYILLYKYIGYYYERLVYMNWTFCSHPMECAHYNLRLESFSFNKYLNYTKIYIKFIKNTLNQFPKMYRLKCFLIFTISFIKTWYKTLLYSLKKVIKRILKYEEY